MITSIPNPKKEINVPFSNEQVLEAFGKISSYCKSKDIGSYEQESFDPIFGELRLTKLEFLSLGVRIIFNTCEAGEGKAKITMEVQRQIGSFDQSFEVTKANEHLNKLTQALSYLLQNPGEEYQKEVKSAEPKKEDGIVGVLATAFTVAFFIWLFI